MYNQSAQGFLWITTHIVSNFSQNLTTDEMDLWGNILSVAGAELSALASLCEINSQKTQSTDATVTPSSNVNQNTNTSANQFQNSYRS